MCSPSTQRACNHKILLTQCANGGGHWAGSAPRTTIDRNVSPCGSTCHSSFQRMVLSVRGNDPLPSPGEVSRRSGSRGVYRSGPWLSGVSVRLARPSSIFGGACLCCRPVTQLVETAVLHGSDRRRDFPYPGHFSCAFELGTSEFGHPVENAAADICFCFLVFEVSRSQFRPDHGLPSSHLCPHAAALIVAGGFLPGQPTTGLYLDDTAVSSRWLRRRLGAGNGVLRGRDNDVCFHTKACCKQITGCAPS